jgi:hypothetical protein
MKLEAVAQVCTVLNSLFFWMIKPNMPIVLLDHDLNATPSFSNAYLPPLTVDFVNAQDFQAEIILGVWKQTDDLRRREAKMRLEVGSTKVQEH